MLRFYTHFPAWAVGVAHFCILIETGGTWGRWNVEWSWARQEACQRWLFRTGFSAQCQYQEPQVPFYSNYSTCKGHIAPPIVLESRKLRILWSLRRVKFTVKVRRKVVKSVGRHLESMWQTVPQVLEKINRRFWVHVPGYVWRSRVRSRDSFNMMPGRLSESRSPPNAVRTATPTAHGL